MAEKIKMAAKHKFFIASQIVCKSIETLDLNRTLYEKNIKTSKLQNGRLNGDGAINHCFFLFAPPNSTYKPILDLL
jgi:hypothetical protein